jgi:heme A synthase
MPVALSIRRLALAGVLLCFVVVVLGAYVRLTAAGLGCPDWPGCYGHVTPLGAEQSATAQAAFPSKPLNVGKAWREMIHRYAASTLGLIIVVIAALAIVSRRQRLLSITYAVALLATVVVQGILGMLTVTWQLKPLIVTLHLLFGMTTLGLLWWLWMSLPRTSWGGRDAGSPSARDRRPHRAGRADRAGRLDEQQLRCCGLPRFSHLSERLVAAYGLPERIRAMARPRS